MSAQLRAISIEYTYEDLCAATANWHASRKLGSGSYGAVFKGELPDGSEVAIKAIDLGALGAAGHTEEMAGFEDEVQMLSKFRHPNLVTLLGWGRHEHMRYLVYELLAGGDAFQRCQKSKRPPPHGNLFHWFERLSCALDSATGLSHMHNSKPKAFHRDIKSANILLDRHGTAKMADFGLSCTSARSGALHVTVKTISGTPGYACPIYSRTGRVTEGSEIYSFGMVMLELLVGMAPATADSRRPGGILYPIENAIAPQQPKAIERCMQHLDSTASWPPQVGHEFGTLALRCVSLTEQQRPQFVELVRAVRSMTERFPPPPRGMIQMSVPQSLSAQMPQVPQSVSAHPGMMVPGVAGSQPAAAQNMVPAKHGGAPQLPSAQQPGSHVPGSQLGARISSSAMPPSATPGGYPGQPAVQSAAPVIAKMQTVAQSSAPGVGQGPPKTDSLYHVELVRAVGVDISELPPELVKLPVKLEAGSGGVAPVGRQHQPEFFEAWLPDTNLRNSISRCAFEICLGPGGNNFQLVSRGSNPISVDGQAAGKGVAVPLRLESEIGFTYSAAGDSSIFLLLRFVAGSARTREIPVISQPKQPSPVAAPARNAGAVIATPVVVGVPDTPASHAITPPSSAASAPKPKAAVPPVSPRFSQGGGGGTSALGWRIECIHAEGLSNDALQALPQNQSGLTLPDVPLMFGRQHQPQFFETLLAGAASRLGFISRTHAQLEARGAGGVLVTNMSSNPLYVDREALAKGDSKTMVQEQILSFARLDGNQHVHFLALKVCPADATNAYEDSSYADPAAFSSAVSRKQTYAEGDRENRRGSGATAPSDTPISTPCATPNVSPEKQRGRHASSDEGQLVAPRLGEPLPAPKAAERPYVVVEPDPVSRPQEPAPRHAEQPPAHRPAEQPPTPKAVEQAPTVAKPPEPAPRPADPPPVYRHEDNPQIQRPAEPKRLAKPVDPPQFSKPVEPPQFSKPVDAPPTPKSMDPPPRMVEHQEPPPSKPSPGGGVAGIMSALEALTSDDGGGELPEVVLELCGEGVLDVSPGERRIGPQNLAKKDLIIGRRHQPELHRRAVSKDCLQFVSRDHFQISIQGNQFRLRPLTSNPIWLNSEGKEPLEIGRGDAATLEFGDRIALGTGGGNISAEEACRKLYWQFRRAGPGDALLPESAVAEGRGDVAAFGSAAPSDDRRRESPPPIGAGAGLTSPGDSPPRTPRSPGGCGPRVSMPFGAMPPKMTTDDAPPDFGGMLLPPASEAVRYPADRPSEVCAPDPRMLPRGYDDDRGGGRQQPSGPSGALQAPVPLGDVREEPVFDRRQLDITERKDEFARSGFRY